MARVVGWSDRVAASGQLVPSRAKAAITRKDSATRPAPILCLHWPAPLLSIWPGVSMMAKSIRIMTAPA